MQIEASDHDGLIALHFGFFNIKEVCVESRTSYRQQKVINQEAK